MHGQTVGSEISLEYPGTLVAERSTLPILDRECDPSPRYASSQICLLIDSNDGPNSDTYPDFRYHNVPLDHMARQLPTSQKSWRLAKQQHSYYFTSCTYYFAVHPIWNQLQKLVAFVGNNMVDIQGGPKIITHVLPQNSFMQFLQKILIFQKNCWTWKYSASNSWQKKVIMAPSSKKCSFFPKMF